MFARFDENPAITLRVIKETKCYGRTHNVKTVYPLQTKFAGGIISVFQHFSFYEQLKFYEKSFITSGPDLEIFRL